jgi:hypothetical protein
MRVVSSLTVDLTFAVESRRCRKGFDRTVMANVVEAFVLRLSSLDRHAAREAVVMGYQSLIIGEIRLSLVDAMSAITTRGMRRLTKTMHLFM